MLEYRGVTKAYDGQQVIPPLDLALAPREIGVLLGPSGCGKTTLLRMAAGLIEPTTGSVCIDAIALGPATLADARRKLGYVIQEGGLFPHLMAVDNVTLMARHQGWSKRQIEERLAELAGLTEFPAAALRRYPRELSGGQRQRVSLMRALFLKPRLLLMDEPLGALDPLIRYSLQIELKRIFAETQATALIVTHDLVEAGRLGDRIFVMQAGRVAQQGAFDEIVRQPANEFVREFVNSQVIAA